LDELECEQLEEKFVTDSEYREQVLIVEEEMLEDYLSESLTSADKAQLDSFYLATPPHQQKLLVARALKRYCSVEEAAHSPPVPADSTLAPRPQPRIARPYRRRTVYALAAVLLLVGLAGLWVLFNRVREPRGGALRQELVRLTINRPVKA
jgi:ferric-dicitrate binding protein FerR (iron transport regulator)